MSVTPVPLESADMLPEIGVMNPIYQTAQKQMTSKLHENTFLLNGNHTNVFCSNKALLLIEL